MRPTGCTLFNAICALLLAAGYLPAWASAAATFIDERNSLLRLDQAQIIMASGDLPPTDDAGWQPQSLPDNWNLNRPGIGGTAWYRLPLPLTQEQLARSPVFAIFIPRLSMNGAVLVNGEPVSDALRAPATVVRQWYLPQHYSVPARLLKPGDNVIHVRLYAYANNRGGLSEVYFGAQPAITTLWQQRYFWGVTSVHISSAITIALGALALLAWSMRRWNTAYGYFGAAALLWGVRNLHFFASTIPIDAMLWEILVATSLVWVLALVDMFVLRFAGKRLPLAERALFAFALTMPVLLWAVGPLRLTVAISLCYLVMLGVGGYILKLLWGVMRRERTIETGLLFAASIVVYTLGAHDWITHRDILNFSEPYNLHVAAPVLFTAVAWNMFKRFTAAQVEADNLNRSLEARVREKSDELERSYEQMRAAEAARTLAAERERIMRDMHDGVGSQLIAAQQLASRGALSTGELTRVLTECIDDLRLVIDSLEPVDGDLVTLLANLRYRLSDRLARQGIVLKWEVADIPVINHLAPHDTLQILRIVQEAFANVLKHSRASEVIFSLAHATEARQLRLTVRDNGCGLPPPATDTSSGGRGIANMKLRAAALGGDLTVGTGLPGCVLILTLPLDAR